ncbi:MAG: outer membrane protein assembly factor BamD [Pseudomonadota bacterium]
MQARRAVIALTLVLALTALGGCTWVSGMWKGLGGGKAERGDAFDVPAQYLANEAEQAYKDGKYDDAADLYQQLKDRYPYSKYALLADLRVADAYLKAKRFDEAALAYDDFIRLHPKNEAVPYAYFQLGMVYHGQMLSVDRDPSNARKAAEAFQRLIRQFPRSEQAQKAMPRLREAYERQAGHDMFVGGFYMRSKQYEAAIGRFKRVLTQYPDIGLYGEAMANINKAQATLDKLTPEERAKRQEERRDLLSSPPNVESPRVVLEQDRGGPPTPF